MKKTIRRCVSAAIFACALLSAVTSASAEVVPVSAYSQLEDIRSVQISPDGTRLAMLAGKTQEDFALLIITLDGSAAPVRVGTEGDRAFSVSWLSDDYVVVYIRKLSTLRNARGFVTQATRAVVVNADGSDAREVADFGRILSRNWEDPSSVLVFSRAVDRRGSRGRTDVKVRPTIMRVDLERGRGRQVDSFDEDVVDILTDIEGNPKVLVKMEVARSDFNRLTYFRVEVPDGRTWRTIYELENEPRPNGGFPINFVGLSEDGTMAFFVREYEGDAQAKLYSMNLSNGEISQLRQGPGVDVNSLGNDPYTGRFLGVSWSTDRNYAQYEDPALQNIVDTLQEALPGSTIRINNWDRSRRRFIVSVRGGQTASSYLLFDRAEGSLSLISQGYPNIPSSEVAPVEYIHYEARDGLTIPAYVTYPVGRDRRDLPMIMLPHGGPETRDFPGFDWWPQMLANRGYVVMQPQFRGSSGYGNAFIEAGWGKWGREMQTDLTDGVHHLVEQGIVDADRVCIFGWSYGGYASAAGITLDPETYRCAVAGAAVTDLREMIRSEGAVASRRTVASDYWEKAIGDVRDDRESLERYSPANNVDQIGGPILLIHGNNDLTVPIEQSNIMVRALREAGKEYGYVVLEGEDHQLLFPDTRAEMGEAAVSFLLRHNPPN